MQFNVLKGVLVSCFDVDDPRDDGRLGERGGCDGDGSRGALYKGQC
jgi:hypothetical protein